MALPYLSAVCLTMKSMTSSLVGGGRGKFARRSHLSLRGRTRLCVVQTRCASSDTANRKARKAGKQKANALAVNKRLKADDSYFWRLKSENFDRERLDKKTETELFGNGDDRGAVINQTQSGSFEIESDTEVTRGGAVGKDIKPIDEFDDTFRSLIPEWTFDNLTSQNRMKYKRPSPIQRHCVPLALTGFDVLASAQTGSGKTVAFLLPLISSIVKSDYFEELPDSAKQPCRPKALILAPTRELALQIENEIQKLTFGAAVGANSLRTVNKRWSCAVYGGSSARGRSYKR